MNAIGRATAATFAALYLATSGCERVQSAIADRMAERALAADRRDLLEDGKLHVILCGTGTPVADRDRAGACTAVIAANVFFLVDVGPGSWRQVALSRLPRADLTAVLLTHFHSDHIGELGEASMQSWVAGRTRPLRVYGPPGVEEVVDGFVQAYARDTGYRIAHHGAEAMPPSAGVMRASTVTLEDASAETVVLDEGGLKVTAFAVDHAPVEPAYGYRFDYGGRSVVVTGDTKKSESVARHARGADLLVHEALAAHMVEIGTRAAEKSGLDRFAKLTRDVRTYHTTPVEAAEIARAADVRLLVLTHIVPPLSGFLARRMFLRGVSDAWDGPVVLGADGMHFELSPGVTEIAQEPLE